MYMFWDCWVASSRVSLALVWATPGDTFILGSYEQQLHRVDGCGGCQRDWAMCHAPYVALWDTRAGRIITARPMVGIMNFHDPYMQWYRRITQRFMTPPLHKDDMRYHTIVGTTQILVS